MSRHLLLAAAVMAAALFMAGCGDDEDEFKALGGGPARVFVLDEVDRTPVAGVKIVVMDGETNVPLAGPVVTGEDGMVAFSDLPVGRYPVLAFGGFRYDLPFLQPDRLHVVNPPQGAKDAPLGPTTPPAPEPPALYVLAYPAEPDSLPRFRGTVVDADTGAPLDLAFIGITPFSEGYVGRTGPSDDVTGPDGSFSVSGVAVGVDPVSGNLIQLQPLRIARHGYRPAQYVHDFPNGSQETDIQGVTLALEPVGEEDTGAITGQVVRGGEPVAGLAVSLGLARAGAKSGPGLTGWGAVTDAEGSFQIEGLPAGTYTVLPGYLLGDGAAMSGAVPAPEVAAGATAAVGEVELYHEISPVEPYRGARVGSGPSRLEWSPVPGAAEYEVVLRRSTIARVVDNAYEFPPETEFAPGANVWKVYAWDGAGGLLGLPQMDFVFRVE